MRTEHGVVLGPFAVIAAGGLVENVRDGLVAVGESVDEAIDVAKRLVGDGEDPDGIEIWVKVPVKIKKLITAEIEGMRK